MRGNAKTKSGVFAEIKRDYKLNKYLVFFSIPVVVWYFIFHYVPMYGVIIAFKDYNVAQGFLASKWVGIEHFKTFFKSYYFVRILINTLLLSFYNLIFSFPIPIILALVLNEVRSKVLKSTIQTITYMPHFISLVVICGMAYIFLSKGGPINSIALLFGGEEINYLMYSQYYRIIYIALGLWQNAGWNSIIYIAALTAIDITQYEAAEIDGANRLHKLWHVTIPGILPTIIITLILNIGRFMSEGSDKTILLYNEATYEVSDIISSYVYRNGLLKADYSSSAAIGLFNSVINMLLIYGSNAFSRVVNETSLW
ncbi:MAG: ABC transporter permease subunit [Firmicutes bacterium]|nr:ABC transporter permease subunit [Bacillota bacterium]